MYSIAAIVIFPHEEEPLCYKIRSADNIESAIEKANALNAELIDRYGDEYDCYHEAATAENMKAEGNDGKILWFVFIKETE